MSNIRVYKNPEEVTEKYAEFFKDEALRHITQSGRFTAVLSGGSSPKKVFEVLASKYQHTIDWTKVYFFFGDERYVPTTDSESNALMAQKSLFEPLNIPENQIFKMNTTLQPNEAAQAYNQDIKQFFNNQPAVFDLVMLGLGDDAHTASLFPGTTALNVDSPTITEVFLPQKSVYRLTMSAPMINQAKEIAFLVYGEGKAAAVKWVFASEESTDKYPAQLIIRTAQWFIDEAAAAQLKTS